ncbi:MAG: hypothetical protein ILP17_11470 [Lachnospiraceae bacterium]|nr:hypothetical protein [Lachnospiraceae bacterium]
MMISDRFNAEYRQHDMGIRQARIQYAESMISVRFDDMDEYSVNWENLR